MPKKITVLVPDDLHAQLLMAGRIPPRARLPLALEDVRLDRQPAAGALGAAHAVGSVWQQPAHDECAGAIEHRRRWAAGKPQRTSRAPPARDTVRVC